MASTHTVNVTYNGTTHSVDYWAGGNGCSYYGYVTSLEQLHDELSETFGVGSLDLYVVDKDGDSKLIKHDRHVKSALKPIHDGGVLAITAFRNESDFEPNSGSDSDNSDWNAVHHSDAETGDLADDDGRAYNIATNRKAIKLLKHFTEHSAECYHCERSDFSGLRYEYSSNSDYSLCGTCYEQLSRSQKRDWSASRPWESDVPDYPIYREEGCPVRDSVRHLQYLYTYIGLMPLDATSYLQGSYQSNTEKATAKFRTKYRIYGNDMTVYDKRTSRKLAQIVYGLRQKGHKYL